MNDEERVRILDAGSGPEVDLVAEGGSAYAIVWPGIGVQLRSMHRISLGPFGRTRQLRHPGEAVYYVVSGSGSVVDAGVATDLVEGSMVHVEPQTTYEFEAESDGLELIGGPAPADPQLYEGI